MTHSDFKLLAEKKQLVLGSGSPRRAALLTDMGIPFSQIIPKLEEKQLNEEQPYTYAQRLAEEKALWVARHLKQDQVVLSCDTIVVLDNNVLEKPSSEEEAFDTLSSLSGKQHVVCTAAALATSDGIMASGYETTEVYFNDVTSEQIKKYVTSGEPMDKAGAYGIQGMGAFLVDRIRGNLDNVIGLPRSLLDKLAKKVKHMV